MGRFAQIAIALRELHEERRSESWVARLLPFQDRTCAVDQLAH